MEGTFKPGDWIAWISYKPNFLAKRIQEYQRHQGFKEPACLATHAEIVWWAGLGLWNKDKFVVDYDRATAGQKAVLEPYDTVCTFSQTFPSSTPVYYRTDQYAMEFRGKKPGRYLFRLQGYDGIVNAAFIYAMDKKFNDLLKRKPTGWATPFGWLGVNYDFLQLANYWLNHLIPGGHHFNILEMPGGLGVCSDKAAEGIDAGLCTRLNLKESPLFPNIPNSEVSPAAIWKEPMYYKVVV